jgi:hypothetical protein
MSNNCKSWTISEFVGALTRAARSIILGSSDETRRARPLIQVTFGGNMTWTEKLQQIAGVFAILTVGACSGTHPLVGSNGATAGGSGGGGEPDQDASAPVLTGSFSATVPGDGLEGGTACIPFALPVDATGNPTCELASAEQTPNCDCNTPGLAPASETLTQATRVRLQLAGKCGPALGSIPCSDFCVCSLPPATGASLQQCLTEASPDASSSGWCYVSNEQGNAATSLLAACTEQQTHEVRILGDAVPQTAATLVLNCDAGTLPASATPLPLGALCVSSDETFPDFAGSDSAGVNVDNNSGQCASRFCVQNHFQGRASCPYGQSAIGGGCLVSGSSVPVSVAVKPQLERRQAAVASICSCQCAGYGPGPYCTCPDDMECDNLVDKLADPPSGVPDLSGSYCIPNGSLYDRTETQVCTTPDCGDAHPY